MPLEKRARRVALQRAGAEGPPVLQDRDLTRVQRPVGTADLVLEYPTKTWRSYSK